jgi:hypothetical protein
MPQKNNGNGTALKLIERQARLLARENRFAEPAITRVFWFPDEAEVRMIELDENVPSSLDGEVHPFYFRASPEDDLPAPTAVALIHPNEYRKLTVPQEWGDWNQAIEIEERP